MIGLLLVALTLLTFYLWMDHHLSYFRRRGIGHEPPLPILGNLWGWKVSSHTSELLQRIYTRYKHTGPYVGFYFLLRPIYVITDMELLKRVFIKDFANFDSRGMFYNERDDPLSAHLLALNGEKWHSLRPRLTPTFSGAKMKRMFPHIVRMAEQLADVMGEHSAGDGSVQVAQLLASYTVDTIGSCVFDIECNSLRDPKAPFVCMGLKAMRKRRVGYLMCVLFPKLGLRMRFKKTPADVNTFYMTLMRDIVDQREQQDIKRNNFVDILLDLKHKYDAGNTEEGLTFEELAAQMYVFLVAGFETASTTLCLALYELARNEDVQSKLRAEIESVLAQHDGEINYEGLHEMKYLEQVVSETLRMHPVATEHVRRAKDHYEVPGYPRHYLPANAQLVIPVYSIHHDPAYYPEPEKFRPERFSEEEVQKRPTCAYLPFGLGPRICIGMRFGKMKVAVALIALVRRYRFKLAPETPVPMEFVKDAFLLQTKGGLRLCVEPV